MTSKIYRPAEFFRALPARLPAHLPKELRRFDTRVRNWMLQVYFNDPYVHYEVSALTQLKVFEVALHFERRGRELNDALMQLFMPHVFEIKGELGPQIQFERWDKGWSKIYDALPLEAYSEEYLTLVAKRLAQLMIFFQPILGENA